MPDEGTPFPVPFSPLVVRAGHQGLLCKSTNDGLYRSSKRSPASFLPRRPGNAANKSSMGIVIELAQSGYQLVCQEPSNRTYKSVKVGLEVHSCCKLGARLYRVLFQFFFTISPVFRD